MSRSTSIPALVNPKLLIWAREEAGYDIDAVAKKLATKPEKLESWELGETHPSFAQLVKLGSVYRRPTSFFYLDETPEREPELADFRRRATDIALPMSPELRLAIRRAREAREIALELYSDLRMTVPDFGLSATMAESPETLGERIRAFVRFDERRSRARVKSEPGPLFSLWRRCVELSGVMVFVVPRISSSEMPGLSLDVHPLPVVLLNSREVAAAKAYSLAHELAHIALHKGGLCAPDRRELAEPDTDIEAYCNAVAAAVLIPDSLLRAQAEAPRRYVESVGDEELRTLANRFGVSREAMLRRLVTIGLVAKSYYKLRRGEFLAEYEAKKKKVEDEDDTPGGPTFPKVRISQLGRLFPRLVFDALAEGRISPFSAARYLGAPVGSLEQLQIEMWSGIGAGEIE